MTGHVRRRGKESWELKFDAGRDSATGKRDIRYHSFRGTKRDAQKKLIELLNSVDQGSYVEPFKLTVAEHVRARVDQWQAAGDITARTAERYRELVEHQIVPQLGDKPLQKLRTVDIEAWHTTLRTSGRKDAKGGVSARTIGHAHRVLSKARKDAARHDLVTRNVVSLQAAPKTDAEPMAILTADRIPAVIGKLRDRPVYAAAVTALFTGLRRGELLALRWRNLDMDGPGSALVHVEEALEETKGSSGGIRFKKPKTASGRRDVTLPNFVVDTLKEHRRRQLELRVALGLGRLPDDALVFPRPSGEAQSPVAFSAAWCDTAAAIGIPEITFHALRHTHASQLIDAGVDVVTISKRLGHASPTTTLQTYAHLFRKSDSKAADAINAALAGIGKA